MKYIAIIDGERFDGYSSFSEKDPKLVVHKGFRNETIRLTPLIRPLVVMDSGMGVFITQGHIDALVKYDTEEKIKQIAKQMSKNLEET